MLIDFVLAPLSSFFVPPPASSSLRLLYGPFLNLAVGIARDETTVSKSLHFLQKIIHCRVSGSFSTKQKPDFPTLKLVSGDPHRSFLITAFHSPLHSGFSLSWFTHSIFMFFCFSECLLNEISQSLFSFCFSLIELTVLLSDSEHTSTEPLSLAVWV